MDRLSVFRSALIAISVTLLVGCHRIELYRPIHSITFNDAQNTLNETVAIDRLALLSEPNILSRFSRYISDGKTFLYSNGEPVGLLTSIDDLHDLITSVGWQEPCFLATVHPANNLSRAFYVIWLDRLRRVAVVGRVRGGTWRGDLRAVLESALKLSDVNGQSVCGIDQLGRFSKYGAVPKAFGLAWDEAKGFEVSSDFGSLGGKFGVFASAVGGSSKIKEVSIAADSYRRMQPFYGATVPGETCLPINEMEVFSDEIAGNRALCSNGEVVLANSNININQLIVYFKDLIFPGAEPVRVVVQSRPEGARFRFGREAQFRSALTNTGPIWASRKDIEDLEIVFDKLGRSCLWPQIDRDQSEHGYLTFTCDFIKAK